MERNFLTFMALDKCCGRVVASNPGLNSSISNVHKNKKENI